VETPHFAGALIKIQRGANRGRDLRERESAGRFYIGSRKKKEGKTGLFLGPLTGRGSHEGSEKKKRVPAKGGDGPDMETAEGMKS